MTSHPPLLRAGIIGTGSVSELHARAIAACPGVELVGVSDLDPERRRAFAEQWNTVPAHDLAALLDLGLDVLHICTPPAAHAQQALAAFAAGVYVVCEKPAALSLDELDRMMAAATNSGRQLAVVFQQRAGTAAAHVRRLLAAGAFGRPLVATCQTLWYRPQPYFDVPWRGSWASEGGGPTLGHGIHQIDLLAHLLGDWASASGQLWRVGRDTETEDVSTAVLTFQNGVVASVVTSALSPRETSSIRIDTELATITVDHLYGHGHENWRITPAPGVLDEDHPEWRLPEREERSGHEAFIREVYDALGKGLPLPEIASEPARSLELVTAIYSSSTTGCAVTPASLRSDAAHRHSLESPVTDLRPGAQRPTA